MRKAILYALILAIFILFLPVQSEANKVDFPTREDCLNLLQNAFHVQVSLSEKERDLGEIKKILSPYFTEQYMSTFLKENLVQIDGRYMTLGTDFALYYIPFFSYSRETKIKKENDQIYVYEFFPENVEGPVGYDDHYEGILLTQENGKWKVSQYFLDFHPDKINKEESSIVEQEGYQLSKFVHELNSPQELLRISMDPLEALFNYGMNLAKKYFAPSGAEERNIDTM